MNKKKKILYIGKDYHFKHVPREKRMTWIQFLIIAYIYFLVGFTVLLLIWDH